MSKKNKSINAYMRELKSLLPLHSKTERQLLHDISQTINEVLNENDSTISREDLVLIVGEPKEIVARYLSEVDVSHLSYSLNIARKVKFLIIGLVIAILVVAISRWGFYYNLYKEVQETIICNEETLIEEE